MKSLLSVKPEIYLYNSLGRKKERLISRTPGVVLLYTCGPTIYDFVHIGNLRTFVFEDLLHRTLKLFGYKVRQVMNLTDVDDKTIRESIKASMNLKEYTDKYAKAFFEDIATLSITPAESYPRATDYIGEMVTMISSLLESGYAYQGADGSVYFAIERYPDYGALSGLSKRADDPSTCSHSRISHDEYDKEVIGDFVLWKSYDKNRDGNVFWPSPFGPGRPGWHIECSAMAKALLGEQIDIHTGGIDNLFPHHENEIAQSFCCSHKQMARFWLHAEHLLVDGRKMSKSLGNFYTLRQLLEHGFQPSSIRYLLLSSHYRHSLNFTHEGLKAAASSVQRLRDFHYRLSQASLEEGKTENLELATQVAASKFMVSLGDDLNISGALAAIFEWVLEFNKALDEKKAKQGDIALGQKFLSIIDGVLGLIQSKDEKAVDPQVVEFFEKRKAARLAKDWKLADELRLQIESAGYLIEDGPSGARLKRK